MPSHHRMLPDEYDDKLKQSHRSRSPTRVPRDRSDHSEPRKSASEFMVISQSLKINSHWLLLCLYLTASCAMTQFPPDHHICFTIAHTAFCPQHRRRRSQKAKTCLQTSRTSVTAKGRPAQENPPWVIDMDGWI